MTPRDYMEAARVPRSIEPQEFGLWKIERIKSQDSILGELGYLVGWPDYTILSRWTEATLNRVRGDIVMEDSTRELRKHLPIWMAARGRILVTGLGLGCVVRGLLAKPEVDRIEVVEIDRDIARIVGREFAGNARVGITLGDATQIDESILPGSFDFAWHDLWMEGDGLQQLHMQLFFRFQRRCGPQGAWDFPRFAKRMITRRGRFQLLGAGR